MREVTFPVEPEPVRPAGQPVPPPRVRLPDSLGVPRSLKSLKKEKYDRLPTRGGK